MSYRATVDFLLHDWLGVEALAGRARHAEHSRETFDAVLDTCEKLAREKFAPANRTADTEEPWFDGERVHLPASTHAASRAYVESGMLAASQDEALGGMRLPCVVEMAANGFFAKAGIGVGGASMLTTGNANLLMAHGTPMQRAVFARHEFSGRFFGTMCLSEPQAGSSLSDIATRATPDGPDFESDPLGPRYRLAGHKMWISNGEHELAENIVHLVLAKIPGPDGQLQPGTRGISLFIVPKWLVEVEGPHSGPPASGEGVSAPHPGPPPGGGGVDASTPLRVRLGERNDVALAGLNHKLGYRGIPNTLLNFGEGRYPVRGAAGALGWRVGAPGDGLRCMFHMMNEARIAVGLGAACIGYAGYEASLAYARERPQGRPIRRSDNGAGVAKDASQPQVPIIRHADVKRMLLAQKSYTEGAIALALWCARQVDELRTGTPEAAAAARTLLEIVTPVAKSWPSEWCLEANSLAIQVLGGYGYTRDFPVEQYWRDNRLNMIHEGTHGIQALDLLGRKVVMDGGLAFAALRRTVQATVERALAVPALADHADALAGAMASLQYATRAAWATGDPEAALANATPYLQAFGHAVLGWIWLDVALAAHARRGRGDDDFLHGKLAAARYFFRYELPRIEAWLKVVETRDDTCRTMAPEWF